MTAAGVSTVGGEFSVGCMQCLRTCMHKAMNHCLETGGRHLEPSHFRLMTNCAEICRTTAGFMLSNSPLQDRLCAACAEVCGACADSAAQIGDMDDCVQACRDCALSCQRMADGQVYGDLGEAASHAGAGRQGQLLM